VLRSGVVIQDNTWYRSGIMSSTEKTISFRAVTDKIAALDSLAAAQERSRSYLINEAITNYIELHAYQDALVRKGMEEMKKGRVVSHDEVVKRLQKTVAPANDRNGPSRRPGNWIRRMTISRCRTQRRLLPASPCRSSAASSSWGPSPCRAALPGVGYS